MSGRGRGRATRGGKGGRSAFAQDSSSDDELDDVTPAAALPVAAASVPLTAPPRPDFGGKPVPVSSRGVTQPLLVARPAAPFGTSGPPADIDAQMRSLPPSPAPTAPTLVDLTSRRLRQFDKTQDAVKAAAAAAAVPLSGANQNGLVPASAAQRTVLPPVIDYGPMRETQTLRHLSIVARDALESQQQTPVEVQFGAARSATGALMSVHASTNNKASAEALHALMQNPRAMLEDRFRNGTPAAQQSAAKILFADEQNVHRRRAMRGAPDELAQEAELRRSEEVLHHVRTTGTRVVANPYDRHAEQNVAEDIFANTAATHANIAGTMIRCEGCSAALGPHLHDVTNGAVLGKVYTSQSSPASHAALLAQVASGQAHVAAPSSAMPRSPSPPPWGWDDADADADDEAAEDDEAQEDAAEEEQDDDDDVDEVPAAAGPARRGKRPTPTKRRKAAAPVKRQATPRAKDPNSRK